MSKKVKGIVKKPSRMVINAIKEITPRYNSTFQNLVHYIAADQNVDVRKIRQSIKRILDKAVESGAIKKKVHTTYVLRKDFLDFMKLCDKSKMKRTRRSGRGRY